MKKFEEVAMNENNPKWENSIKREAILYNPQFGVGNMRNEFDRDYTRVINCNAYRRLKHKTQVFLAPEVDHLRTRLTHTLEVAQIARTISKALRLNEDLTEAIALGHDLGHTPFGWSCYTGRTG